MRRCGMGFDNRSLGWIEGLLAGGLEPRDGPHSQPQLALVYLNRRRLTGGILSTAALLWTNGCSSRGEVHSLVPDGTREPERRGQDRICARAVLPGRAAEPFGRHTPALSMPYLYRERRQQRGGRDGTRCSPDRSALHHGPTRVESDPVD